eukprot:3281697-Amphidinium_carterae.1
MAKARCTTKNNEDAYDHFDNIGQRAFDQPNIRQLPQQGEEHNQNYDNDDDYIDDDGHQSTFDEGESNRLSGTTKAS